MPLMDTPHSGTQQTVDARPLILICSWSKGEPVWDLVEDLTGVPWSPDNARSELITGSGNTAALADQLLDKLLNADCRALLLIGRTRHEGPALLQVRSEVPKIDGQRLGSDKPGVVRATAPAAEIIEAATKAKVSIVVSSANEDDEGSELLYRIMAAMEDRLEVPSVALLRFPQHMAESSIAASVKSAVNVMTQNLLPLSRLSAQGRY